MQSISSSIEAACRKTLQEVNHDSTEKPALKNSVKNYMSDKAAQLLDADVLRKFFGDLNTVALDGNFDRKALSARRED